MSDRHDVAERPTLAPLFDAALHQCRKSYGPRERPKVITIYTATGLEVSFEVPFSWEIEENETGQPKLPNPGAIADILHLFVDVGHRLTRDEVCAELRKRGKRRADSVVGDTLSLLIKLGVLNNRQDVEPNGFGLRDWGD